MSKNVTPAWRARGATAQPPNRAWKALNAPFTIFLLSSVALGGISAAFTFLQSSAQEKSARRQVGNKLQVEIVSRIARADAIVEALLVKYAMPLPLESSEPDPADSQPPQGELTDDEEEPKDRVDATDLYIILAMLQALDAQSLLSDFSNNNLPALIWQFRQQRTDGSEEFDRAAEAAMTATLSLQNKLELQWKPNVRCEIAGAGYLPAMTTVFTGREFVLAELKQIDAALSSVRALVQPGTPQQPIVDPTMVKTYTSFADYYCQKETAAYY